MEVHDLRPRQRVWRALQPRSDPRAHRRGQVKEDRPAWMPLLSTLVFQVYKRPNWYSRREKFAISVSLKVSSSRVSDILQQVSKGLLEYPKVSILRCSVFLWEVPGRRHPAVHGLAGAQTESRVHFERKEDSSTEEPWNLPTLPPIC